jgi:hypothetical protein
MLPVIKRGETERTRKLQTEEEEENEKGGGFLTWRISPQPIVGLVSSLVLWLFVADRSSKNLLIARHWQN